MTVTVTVQSVTTSNTTSTGANLDAGETVTITLAAPGGVPVSGKMVLNLNDGGTATFDASKSTYDAATKTYTTLVFDYTVGANQNTSDLAVTGVTLGNNWFTNADFSKVIGPLDVPVGTPASPAPIQVDTTAPTITSITATTSSGSLDLNAGKVVTITVHFSEAVNVTPGTVLPTIALNNGGTATYVSGSGSDALVFTYTVGARDTNTSTLATTAAGINLAAGSGSTIKDAAGNSAVVTGANKITLKAGGSNIGIDTTTPAIVIKNGKQDISFSPSGTKEGPSTTITVAVHLNETVTVTGTPEITLSNGAVANYVGGSGSDILLFTYVSSSAKDQTWVANNTVTVTQFDLPGGASITDGGGNAIPCFMPGTLVRTPDGERAVESLAIGDLVLTAEGEAKPVVWIGRATVSRVFADPLRVLPIRIAAGALGENLPVRDLLLSPDHALLVDGVLIQAGALVNGTTIRRDSDVPTVFTYYHVELADHALILTEGVPAETFVDNVDRMVFDNWDEHLALYPQGLAIDELPLPRAKSHRQVPMAIRARLADRAAALVGTEVAAA